MRDFCISWLVLLLVTASLIGQDLPVDNRCIEVTSTLDSLISKEIKIDLNIAFELRDELKEKDCKALAQAYNYLGYLHYNNSDLVSARKYLLLGEEIYLANPSNPKYLALNQIYSGLVLIIEKNDEAALYHFEKGKELAELSTDESSIAFANLNLGLIKLELEQWEEAEQLYKQILTYPLINPEHTAYATQNLARIYLHQGMYQKALQHVAQTKNMWAKLNHSKGLYYVSLTESKVFSRLGQHDKALNALLEGREKGEFEATKLLAGENYLMEANIHLSNGQKEKAATALLNAFENIDDLQFEDIEKATNSLLSTSILDQDKRTIDALLNIIKEYKKRTFVSSQLSVKKQKLIDDQINKKEVIETNYQQGQVIIKRQFIVICAFFAFFSLLFSLMYRLYKQKSEISSLNLSLTHSKKQIEHQVDILEQRNEELKQYAYVASHDLKSPLRTIKSFSQIIEKKLEDKVLLDHFSYIKDASEDMTLMISNLLIHATSDQAFNLSDVRFSKILNKALKNLDTDIRSSETTITLDCKEDRPFACDEVKLIQVVQNLISNGISYSREGIPPKISVSSRSEGKNFVFSVKDNGIGIVKENQEMIFEMFHRLKDKKSVAGSGIGLATCKKIVDTHQGTISVNSVYGEGTEIIVTIPQ